jgi:protein-S-isoprenylcysteine O-methyltransferase Ste14
VPELALAIYVLYLGLAFGVRTALHRRQTGSSGFHGISGRLGSAEWTGGVMFVVAILLGFLAPVLDLLGVVDPVGALNRNAVNYAGAALALSGLALTLYAQGAMGESWRIGVSDDEQTTLVTTGPFASVRNPIFGAMLPTSLGLVLVLPNWVSITGFAALVAALELQTRFVEEPYLLRVHARQYSDYAARAGRFIPLIGRLRPPHESSES